MSTTPSRLTHRFRFVILALATACLSLLYANVLAFKYATICMTANVTANVPFSVRINPLEFELFGMNTVTVALNGTAKALLASLLAEHVQKGEVALDFLNDVPTTSLADIQPEDFEALELHREQYTVTGIARLLIRPPDYVYTSFERSALFSSVAVGALVAANPVAHVITTYGAHRCFTAIGVLSAAVTAIFPLLASLGFHCLVVGRLIQGIAFAAAFPIVGIVTAKWASLGENGIFNGALTSFIQLAPVVAGPVTGFSCASHHWSWTFYIHGILTVIMFICWFKCYRDEPSSHVRVTQMEAALICDGKALSAPGNDKPPLCEIYSTPAVWAVWIAAVANMLSVQLVTIFGALYMSEVLHLPVLAVGVLSALPTLIQFFVKLSAGHFSDRIDAEETTKVKLFNSVAFLGMAIFFFATPRTAAIFASPVPSVAALVAAASVLGFNVGGFFKSATLIGQRFAPLVNSNVQTAMSGAILVLPPIVFGLTPNKSLDDWHHVFDLAAVTLLVGNAIFVWLGSGVPAAFVTRSRHTLA